MVEEAERIAYGYRIEPQRQLRKLDGHWVEIDAKDARFDYPPFPIRQRRFIVLLAIGLLVIGMWVGCDLLGKILAGPDQEVARAHSRIEYAKTQDPIGKISLQCMELRLKLKVLLAGSVRDLKLGRGDFPFDLFGDRRTQWFQG